MFVQSSRGALALCSFRVPLGPDVRQDDRFDSAFLQCVRLHYSAFESGRSMHITNLCPERSCRRMPVPDRTLNEHREKALDCTGNMIIGASYCTGNIIISAPHYESLLLNFAPFSTPQ